MHAVGRRETQVRYEKAESSDSKPNGAKYQQDIAQPARCHCGNDDIKWRLNRCKIPSEQRWQQKNLRYGAQDLVALPACVQVHGGKGGKRPKKYIIHLISPIYTNNTITYIAYYFNKYKTLKPGRFCDKIDKADESRTHIVCQCALPAIFAFFVLMGCRIVECFNAAWAKICPSKPIRVRLSSA